MKKYNFLLSLILFSGLVGASPIEVNFLELDYQIGEPIQMEVSTTDLVSPMTQSYLRLDKGDSEIQFYPYISNLGFGNYFIYFESNELIQGDYNLSFNNLIYSLNGSTYQDNSISSFSLTSSNLSSLVFSPGFIDARDNFFFEIYVLNQGIQEIDLSFTTSKSFIEVLEESLVLAGSHSKLVSVYISELLSQSNSGMEYIYLNYNSQTYSIPVWFGMEDSNLAEGEEEYPLIEGENETVNHVNFITSEIYKNLTYGESIYGGYVEILNQGNDSVENISIGLSDSLEDIIEMETTNIANLDSGEIFKLYLILNQENLDPGSYEGSIYLENSEIFEELIFNIQILGLVELEIESEELVEDYDEIIIIEEEIKGDKDIEKDEKLEVPIWMSFLLFILIVFIILYIIYIKKKK